MPAKSEGGARMDISEAYQQVSTLRQQLGKLVDRDPDQEVRGIAVQTLDKVLGEARKLLPSHVVVETMHDLISPEQIAEGEEIRASDLLLVVNALFVALSGPYSAWGNSQPSGWEKRT